jgi:hypothetical protein
MSDKERSTEFFTGWLDHQDLLDNKIKWLTVEEAEEVLGLEVTGEDDER